MKENSKRQRKKGNRQQMEEEFNVEDGNEPVQTENRDEAMNEV
jgi:hypothetical protein